MLDTLKYSKQLQQADVSREQAEALHEAASESVAARAQLESVGLELVGRIDHAVQRLDAKMDALRSERMSAEQHLDAKIDGVEQRLDTKINSGGQCLNAKIAGVDLKLSAEIRQLRWMMGVLVALNAAILVKLLLI
ncbi:hypothetical protein [Nitrococcus mobilis]|uniref:BdrR n=1 Tax=Nitrococcus mobilis Nb-231 TaxID=314278 RepID=A4BV31_9GAMM|nr:hypothetical protein [Nitrococcus mobilis]EAR20452.1 BdrR [Nitrococcus mobilis Nb-231]